MLSGRPRQAWELYAAAQAAGQPAATGEAGYALLHQIADDCYRMGAFYYAAKVFVCAQSQTLVAANYDGDVGNSRWYMHLQQGPACTQAAALPDRAAQSLGSYFELKAYEML